MLFHFKVKAFAGKGAKLPSRRQVQHFCLRVLLLFSFSVIQLPQLVLAEETTAQGTKSKFLMRPLMNQLTATTDSYVEAYFLHQFLGEKMNSPTLKLSFMAGILGTVYQSPDPVVQLIYESYLLLPKILQNPGTPVDKRKWQVHLDGVSATQDLAAHPLFQNLLDIYQLLVKTESMIPKSFSEQQFKTFEVALFKQNQDKRDLSSLDFSIFDKFVEAIELTRGEILAPAPYKQHETQSGFLRKSQADDPSEKVAALESRLRHLGRALQIARSAYSQTQIGFVLSQPRALLCRQIL